MSGVILKHPDTHSIHVHKVPTEIWQQARINSISSRLSFRDYLIRVLKDAKPFLPSGPSNAENTSSSPVSPGSDDNDGD